MPHGSRREPDGPQGDALVRTRASSGQASGASPGWQRWTSAWPRDPERHRRPGRPWRPAPRRCRRHRPRDPPEPPVGGRRTPCSDRANPRRPVASGRRSLRPSRAPGTRSRQWRSRRPAAASRRRPGGQPAWSLATGRHRRETAASAIGRSPGTGMQGRSPPCAPVPVARTAPAGRPRVRRRSSRWRDHEVPVGPRSCSGAGDADDRVRFVSGVSNQVEEAAPGYGRLRYRPGVPEVPPNVAQRDVRVVVPKTGVDDLQVRSDGIP